MMRAKYAKDTQGFTLIELMIVVVIVAIIAAIAIPQYGQYVLRGKLTEATSNLGQLRVRAEQTFQDTRSYATMACAPSNNDAKYFTYDCSVAGTTNAYTLRATGVAAQGTGGMTYTVDQTNTKTTVITSPSKWTAGTYTCWVTKQTSC